VVHGVNEGDDVVLLNVNVPDWPAEELFLGRHSSRIARLGGRKCEFQRMKFGGKEKARNLFARANGPGESAG
jgi:hypothetical protein